MVEAIPETASDNAELREGLQYFMWGGTFAIPVCLDVWDKLTGKGNDKSWTVKFRGRHFGIFTFQGKHGITSLCTRKSQ